MKKLVFIALLLFTLSGCEKPIDVQPNCNEDQKNENGVCVDIENPNQNTSDPLVKGEGCNQLENIGDYIPVWCDEFDYEGLPNSDKWSYDVGGHGWGNNELQYYTENDLDNANVKNGFLTITARKEAMENKAYTSARLVTKGKGDWLYGKIQIKAKLPSGVGTWPAIWMLPTDWSYGGWPYSGEIDIMEHVGYDMNKVYSTIHTGAYNHTLGTQIGFEYTSNTLETDFHVYEIEWEPGIIKSYIDGILYATFTYNPDTSEGIKLSDAWPFDDEFHLILNIAVGGSWGGQQGVDTDIWPQEMVVDYVRVYQKDYASGDNVNPEVIQNIEAVNTTSSSSFIKWDKGNDNKMVKEYDVYLDGELLHTQSHNAVLLEGLVPATIYKVGVVAVDFAGNKSVISETSFETASPESISGIIEAEDYATQQGIDTEETSDIGGGLNIGWTHNGDYLEYVLLVEESGYYTIDFRVASGINGGSFDFIYKTTALNLTVPATGSWQTWTTITSSQIFLEEGIQTFKIVFSQEGTNLNYFEFKKVE